MDPVQANQVLISQDGDTLVIQLPNAILRVLLPTVLIAGRATTAEVFSERYERRVDLVAQRGRFEVRDVDHNLLVDYQEMSSSWTEDALPLGFDIQEESTNVSAANSVFEEPLAHGRHDTRSRSRSSNFRGRSSNTARKSTPDTDHDLFLHDSPPAGANKRKVDRDTSPPTVISPEKHKRIAVVPKENSIPQIMRASERVRAHSVGGHHNISARARTWNMSKSKRQTSESTAGRRRTTPPAAKLAQSTPPSHRFQTPSSSGTLQCNNSSPPATLTKEQQSSPATLKGGKIIHTPAVSASSSSTNYYYYSSSPPAAAPPPHIPWREIGRQPLVVKYKGTMDSRSRSREEEEEKR
ncbi:MAG: hypothetical protein Q9193_000923, partial [Seirophora villosa]